MTGAVAPGAAVIPTFLSDGLSCVAPAVVVASSAVVPVHVWSCRVEQRNLVLCPDLAREHFWIARPSLVGTG